MAQKIVKMKKIKFFKQNGKFLILKEEKNIKVKSILEKLKI